MPTTHGTAPCSQSAVGRRAILHRVFENNLGIAAPASMDRRATRSSPGTGPSLRVRHPSEFWSLSAAALACTLVLLLIIPGSDLVQSADRRGGFSADAADIGREAPPAAEIESLPSGSVTSVPEPSASDVHALSSAASSAADSAPDADLKPDTGLAAGASPISNNRDRLTASDGVRAGTRLLAAGEQRPLASLFGLTVHTVVIDPGHGGVDPGAVGVAVDGRSLYEKDLTLDVAKRLAILLRRDQGVRVVLTRDDDKTVSLAHRVEISNAAAADLFISIHANSLGDARANAVETYYFGAPADGDTWRLAQQENAESGMPIGAFRELVATLGDTLKRQESVTLAHFVQTQLLAVVMRRTGPLGAGVKVAPFVVLMGVEAPSVLAEVTCISNGREAARLAAPAYRQAIAEALGRGLIAYIDQRNGGQRNGQSSGEAQHEQSISKGENGGYGNG